MALIGQIVEPEGIRHSIRLLPWRWHKDRSFIEGSKVRMEGLKYRCLRDDCSDLGSSEGGQTFRLENLGTNLKDPLDNFVHRAGHGDYGEPVEGPAG